MIILPKILTLDINGKPLTWVTYKEAAVYAVKDHIQWSIGNNYFLTGGWNRIRQQVSKIKINDIIALKNTITKYSVVNPIPSLNNTALFARDRSQCAYCGRLFRRSDLSRDHIIPTSKGGKDTWLNCVTACKRCNNKKGDSTAELPLKYQPFVPNRAEQLILSNYYILPAQLTYLEKLSNRTEA